MYNFQMDFGWRMRCNIMCVLCVSCVGLDICGSEICIASNVQNGNWRRKGIRNSHTHIHHTPYTAHTETHVYLNSAWRRRARCRAKKGCHLPTISSAYIYVLPFKFILFMRRKKKRRENVHANRICVWNYEIVGDVNSFPTD